MKHSPPQLRGCGLVTTIWNLCDCRFCDLGIYPDPPILAFFDFLAFFVFRFPLLFCAFCLPSPRILGVPQREKPLLFSGLPCFFSKKSKGWRVRVSLNIFWGQIVPPRENGQIFPQVFPARENSSLSGTNFFPEISSPFPSNYPHVTWNEGFEKKEFLWLKGKLWLVPARENYPQAIVSSKDSRAKKQTWTAKSCLSTIRQKTITRLTLSVCNYFGGSFFYLQLELFCLQVSFFAYSPSRSLLDALFHCKQKSSNCKQRS